MDAYSENAEFLLLSSASKVQLDSSKEMCHVASVMQATGGTITRLEASSLLQVSDNPSSTDVFVERRVLNFEDTPCKISLEEGPSRAFSKGAPDCRSVMLQLVDDEVSESSVNVNVGSPVYKESLVDAYSEKTEFLSLSSTSKVQPDSSKEMGHVASGIHCFSNTASGGDNPSLKASSALEVSDTPSSTGVFVGRRVLNFDDTPCKISLEEGSNRAFPKVAPYCSSVMLQLEDDEVTECSVNLNSNESIASGTSFLPGSNKDPSVLCEHVRMVQQVASSKVQLRWDKDNERKVFEDEKDNKAKGYKRNKDCSDYDADSSADQDDDYYGDGECGDLCDMFMHMSLDR